MRIHTFKHVQIIWKYHTFEFQIDLEQQNTLTRFKFGAHPPIQYLMEEQMGQGVGYAFMQFIINLIDKKINLMHCGTRT